MRKELYECDRCGKPMSPVLGRAYHFWNSEDELDLCKSCYTDLVHWLWKLKAASGILPSAKDHLYHVYQ